MSETVCYANEQLDQDIRKTDFVSVEIFMQF